MIRRPPRSTPLYSSAASDVYKRQTYQFSFAVVFQTWASAGPEVDIAACSAQSRSTASTVKMDGPHCWWRWFAGLPALNRAGRASPQKTKSGRQAGTLPGITRAQVARPQATMADSSRYLGGIWSNGGNWPRHGFASKGASLPAKRDALPRLQHRFLPDQTSSQSFRWNS